MPKSGLAVGVAAVALGQSSDLATNLPQETQTPHDDLDHRQLQQRLTKYPWFVTFQPAAIRYSCECRRDFSSSMLVTNWKIPLVCCAEKEPAEPYAKIAEELLAALSMRTAEQWRRLSVANGRVTDRPGSCGMSRSCQTEQNG